MRFWMVDASLWLYASLFHAGKFSTLVRLVARGRQTGRVAGWIMLGLTKRFPTYRMGHCNGRRGVGGLLAFKLQAPETMATRRMPLNSTAILAGGLAADPMTPDVKLAPTLVPSSKRQSWLHCKQCRTGSWCMPAHQKATQNFEHSRWKLMNTNGPHLLSLILYPTCLRDVFWWSCLCAELVCFLLIQLGYTSGSRGHCVNVTLWRPDLGR